MNPRHCFVAWAVIWLTCAPCDRVSGAQEITTLKELKDLGPGKGPSARSLKLRGVVVCYDAGWHQLYLHDGREALYFNADDFQAKPRTGQVVEITGIAHGRESFTNLELKVLGPGVLPKAKHLDLGELSTDHGEWIETAGQVLSVETSRGRTALLLHDKRQNCLVYLLGGPPTS